MTSMVGMQIYRTDEKHTDGRGNIRAKASRCKNDARYKQQEVIQFGLKERFEKRCISFFDMCFPFNWASLIAQLV